MCHWKNQLVLRHNTRLHWHQSHEIWLSTSGSALGATTVSLSPLHLAFFFFFALYRSNSSTFLNFHIFPFRAFLETYLTHFFDTVFDVSYLSRLLLETGISGGISTISNIYEYFGLQLSTTVLLYILIASNRDVTGHIANYYFKLRLPLTLYKVRHEKEGHSYIW